MPDIVVAFGLIATVLILTALASGLIERSVLSFPFLFIALGFALGERGVGLLVLGPHSAILEVVATLTLALVLFLDAVKLQVDELGKRWLIPFLILVPGTVLIIILGSLPLALLLGFGWVMAFIGGALLASTDPVVLRDILRDKRIPRPVRQVLKLEGGMNDLVVLPVVLVLIAVSTAQVGGLGQWAPFLTKLLVLGPAVGAAIGFAGAWCMSRVDAHMGIRLEHQAMYGIGLVLASYASATILGGDGFLGAFFAGLAVVVLNQKLCRCFLDYGEVTSEMMMMMAFVLFGAVLSGIIDTVPLLPALGLAALVIFVIRPVVINLVLARAKMSWEARAFVSWFGPRGLNSLLLALLVVEASVPGAELLLATVGIVVLASVVIHGASASPIAAWYSRKASEETLVEERESTVAGLFRPEDREVPRVTAEELDRMLSSAEPPIVLDVRSRSTYEHDDAEIPGSVRVLPDQALDWIADELPKGLTSRQVVAYCT
ncbi:MAG: cation:proton antiporter [Chloroflexi bacterium]|nr:cation:proton antiporter [Chloroflexota bacterium]